MAKNNNLQDFLTDIANSIRTKTGTTQPINAQNFSTEILNIPTGGENTLKNLLDATQKAEGLFLNYKGDSVDNLIAYNDTENVVVAERMFKDCINLLSIPLLDTSNLQNIEQMFNGCSSITTIPLFNFSKANNIRFLFNNCLKLEVIPELDFSSVPSDSLYSTNIFGGCSSLKSILATGIKFSFNISASTQFEKSDLVTILNNLATVTTTKTLTMGATNLAKLTDEDKAIATNKGWTLA